MATTHEIQTFMKKPSHLMWCHCEWECFNPIESFWKFFEGRLTCDQKPVCWIGVSIIIIRIMFKSELVHRHQILHNGFMELFGSFLALLSKIVELRQDRTTLDTKGLFHFDSIPYLRVAVRKAKRLFLPLLPWSPSNWLPFQDMPPYNEIASP